MLEMILRGAASITPGEGCAIFLLALVLWRQGRS